ncbi:radical SAM protein [Tistrella bauzanensis]|uniref:radical SAM protein n=1 Tax=Tistrella TaxID=171436 RepID=UPI0031F68499
MSDPAAALALASSGLRFAPEDNPFRTVIADVTHRCNMVCRNCYIPNRDVPDLDADWLIALIARFPRRIRLRIVGAEPTMRRDLPDLIARVRDTGHLPVLLTNALKLADRRYVARLKASGLRTVHVSFDGGLDDDLYEAVDDLRCATKKLAALDNMCAENLFVTAGMILVRGVNDGHLPVFMNHLRGRPQVREIHLRSVGQIGRFMETDPFRLDELIRLAETALDRPRDSWQRMERGRSHLDFFVDGVKFQLTEWPDLGSEERGRITPEGFVEPFFEHVMANENRY